ncbi:MAG TPA: HAD-IIA family hydrolase [Candidatus Hydrogenedens sp.]|nr:HAD-IIA family hydrolase [Candidatus Hydrogenedens sp.]HPP59908.1 HAD-IIA family hydrolase [Candidatus Hydrogenedens sp.]
MTQIEDIQCFLLDMDGTIYLGNRPIPGAKEFIGHLKLTGKKYLFFTNNPTKDAEQYQKKLGMLGIHVSKEHILTSGMATVEYLKRNTTYKKLFTVAPPSFEKELIRAGFHLVQDEPDAVVISFDITLTYEKLRKATYWLLQGLPYIATNPDLVCPTEDGPIPDCGSIAKLLHASTGREPRYIGKPNPEMIEMALKILNMRPQFTAMVGDRLYTDMEMAYRAGVTSILVLSGETTMEQLNKIEKKPDYIFPSISELLCAIKT